LKKYISNLELEKILADIEEDRKEMLSLEESLEELTYNEMREKNQVEKAYQKSLCTEESIHERKKRNEDARDTKNKVT
jgi:hypothetical protein